MSTDSLQVLLGQWQTEALSQERAIGQLLQHLMRLEEVAKTGQTRRTEIQTAIDVYTVNWANLKLTVEALQLQAQHVNTRLERLESHFGLPPLKPPGKRGRPPKNRPPKK
ncbi:hypothetical protein QUF64_10425 [Anaerolineales bacterium HSG6]|nr:hypothetical protein [Anaerolineales bacterium HSG6]